MKLLFVSTGTGEEGTVVSYTGERCSFKRTTKPLVVIRFDWPTSGQFDSDDFTTKHPRPTF